MEAVASVAKAGRSWRSGAEGETIPWGGESTSLEIPFARPFRPFARFRAGHHRFASGGPAIDRDEKTYSDEEFALILRKASELARSPDSSAGARSGADGLSLADMKEIAAEAGLDPALVERAVRHLDEHRAATGLERIAGAPVTVRLGAEFDTPLTLERAEGLLALVRATAEQQGEGSATGSGVSWHTVGEGTQLLVTIHEANGRTQLRVVADRTGALAITGVLSLLGSLGVGVAVLLAGELSGIQVHPLVGVGVIGGAAGGVLATARAIWKSTAVQVRARAASLMDTLGRSIESLDVDDR